MHPSKQTSRLPKAKQHASSSATTRQRQSAVVNEPSNLSAGVPNIDISQLIAFLQSLGIAAVEADVREPTSRRTRELCELLLQYFVPHRIPFLKIQKERAAREFKESLEISMEHAEAMPVYREFQYFLENIDFKDFTITDILSPTTHRLQRMLSIVYNFKLFRDTSLTAFQEMAQKAVDKTAMYEARLAEKKALQAKIQQLKAKKEAERQEAQEWEAKNQEAENIVRQLRREGDAILKDIDTYKTERKQLKDTLFTMINTIEYIRTLRQYESMDVAELNKSMADLATVIQKNTEEVNHMEVNYPKIEQEAKDTKAISAHLAKEIQRMESLTKLKADVHRQQKTNEAVKQNIQSVMAKQKDLHQRLKACVNTVNIVNGRLQSLAVQKDKKAQLVDMQFKDLEARGKAWRKENQARDDETARHNDELEKMLEKREMTLADHQRFMQALHLQIRTTLETIAETDKKWKALQNK
ncbi:hypothetical protein MBANPS3_011676 [Mucor bainieri]